jgi:hypothetical protein
MAATPIANIIQEPIQKAIVIHFHFLCHDASFFLNFL